MLHRSACCALTLLLALATASSAAAFSITVYDVVPTLRSTGYTVVNGSGTNTSSTSNVFPATYPYSDTTVKTQGGSSATTVYDFQGDAFQLTFDHTRDTTPYAQAFSHGEIYFSVDEDVQYAMSGAYSVLDSDPQVAAFGALLREDGVPGYLYQSNQGSSATVDASFVLGGTAGDSSNSLYGSATGLLLAGHVYVFEYGARIWNFSSTSATSGATASGHVLLELAAIPEPATGALLGIGLLGMARRRRPRVH